MAGEFSRQRMAEHIAKGGSVLIDGAPVTNAEHLPGEVDLVGDDPARRAELEADLLDRKAQIERDLKRLQSGAAPKRTPAPRTAAAKIDAPPPDEGDESDESENDAAATDKMKAHDLIKYVGECDDAAELSALYEAETAREDPRSTVVAAIEKRVKQLDGDDE